MVYFLQSISFKVVKEYPGNTAGDLKLSSEVTKRNKVKRNVTLRIVKLAPEEERKQTERLGNGRSKKVRDQKRKFEIGKRDRNGEKRGKEREDEKR